MDEIIKIKNTSYALYEELLMRRDNLRKDAFIAQRNYVAEFGDMILDVFQKKVDCICKKKKIEYCQAALNHGRSIDEDALQAYLAQEMAAFQQQLEDMIEDTEAAKNREIISELDLLKIKRIYHKLVKKIHPDINPLTETNKILSELWYRVQIAYNCNVLKDLEELQVLVDSALEDLNIEGLELELPDIDIRIAELEKEIHKIRTTDPYLYRELLEDEAAVEEKKESLRQELKEYEEYALQLDEVFAVMIEGGVKHTWLMS